MQVVGDGEAENIGEELHKGKHVEGNLALATQYHRDNAGQSRDDKADALRLSADEANDNGDDL